MGRPVEVRAYDTTNILLSACSKIRHCQGQQQQSVSASCVVWHATANKMLLLRSTKGQRQYSGGWFFRSLRLTSQFLFSWH